MTGLTKLAVVGAMSLALVACAGMELDRARGLQPQGTDFAVNLYKNYLDLSEAEFAEADYADSDTFALRAMAAGSGNPPEPEAVDARDLPADKVGELAEARTRLFAALNGNARTKVAAHAALAQAMFDCWMQEQEENFQPADIAACRAAFLAAMEDVDVAMVAEPAPKPVKAPEPKPMATPIPANSVFFVYFDFDKSDLTEAAAAVIAAAARAAQAIGDVRLVVSGHADRSGTDDYNQSLSQDRANAAAQALVAQGVGAGTIEARAYGESQPVFKTADGVREPGNRRVQIDLTR